VKKISQKPKASEILLHKTQHCNYCLLSPYIVFCKNYDVFFSWSSYVEIWQVYVSQNVLPTNSWSVNYLFLIFRLRILDIGVYTKWPRKNRRKFGSTFYSPFQYDFNWLRANYSKALSNIQRLFPNMSTVGLYVKSLKRNIKVKRDNFVQWDIAHAFSA